MTIKVPADLNERLIDKQWLRQAMNEVNERMGFVPDPEATLEKIRAMMKAEGIRPEDNFLSREILRMRYEEVE